MADPAVPPWQLVQWPAQERKALAEEIARQMEDYNRHAGLVDHWRCEIGCGGWVKVDWVRIVDEVIKFVELETSPQYAAGVAEGRRQAAEDLERAAAEQLAEAKRRRELMRFPSDRPGWLGSGQPWPCGRCGREVDDEDPHECVIKAAAEPVGEHSHG